MPCTLGWERWRPRSRRSWLQPGTGHHFLRLSLLRFSASPLLHIATLLRASMDDGEHLLHFIFVDLTFSYMNLQVATKIIAVKGAIWHRAAVLPMMWSYCARWRVFKGGSLCLLWGSLDRWWKRALPWRRRLIWWGAAFRGRAFRMIFLTRLITICLVRVFGWYLGVFLIEAMKDVRGLH